MKRDCSDEIELKNGRALPGGWNTVEMWHLEHKIGSIYCGKPEITADGYSFEVINEGTQDRLIVSVETTTDAPLE